MTSIENNVIEGIQSTEEDDDEGVFLFGRNVSKIPCFKDSLLTGVYAGFGCGVASFLATSQAVRSTHISVLSFGVITIGYWFNCRRQWAKDYFAMKQSEATFPEEIESVIERKKRKKSPPLPEGS